MITLCICGYDGNNNDTHVWPLLDPIVSVENNHMKKSSLAAVITFTVIFAFLFVPAVSADTVEKTVVIESGDIVIPMANFDGGTADVTVPKDSVAGIIYQAYPDVEFWFKPGSTKTWFNLNTLEGRTHKDGGEWTLYVGGVEQTTDMVNDWSDVIVTPGDTVKLIYDTDGYTVKIKTTVANTATPVSKTISGVIKTENVTIPASQISGSDTAITVAGDSLIGVLANSLSNVEFYMGGTQNFFNLNTYDGHTHKSPNKTDKWYAYIDGKEVSVPDWSTVKVTKGQVITLKFDDITNGAIYEYTITTSTSAGGSGTQSPVPVAGLLIGLAAAGLFAVSRKF